MIKIGQVILAFSIAMMASRAESDDVALRTRLAAAKDKADVDSIFDEMRSQSTKAFLLELSQDATVDEYCRAKAVQMLLTRYLLDHHGGILALNVPNSYKNARWYKVLKVTSFVGWGQPLLPVYTPNHVLVTLEVPIGQHTVRVLARVCFSIQGKALTEVARLKEHQLECIRDELTQPARSEWRELLRKERISLYLDGLQSLPISDDADKSTAADRELPDPYAVARSLSPKSRMSDLKEYQPTPAKLALSSSVAYAVRVRGGGFILFCQLKGDADPEVTGYYCQFVDDGARYVGVGEQKGRVVWNRNDNKEQIELQWGESPKSRFKNP